MALSKAKRTAAAGAQRLHRKKGVNLSRKQILEAKRVEWLKKKKVLDEAKHQAKKAKIEQIQRRRNKQVKRVFEHQTLHAIQEGLTSAIGMLGEPITPLSVFMAAFTALSRAAERPQIPYMLAILSSCLPHLSQGFLQYQAKPLFELCEEIFAEYAATDHLIVAKAMKLVQEFLLALEEPTMEILRHVLALAPSKLHVEAMELYLISLRKFLEQSALRYGSCAGGAPTGAAPGSSPSASPSGASRFTPTGAPRKDPDTGFYPLSPSQAFFVQAVPHFMDLALANLSEAPPRVATATFRELTELFQRSLSPYLVESREGTQMLEGLLSHQLLSLFKPFYQSYWGLSLGVLEALFDRINYLKRVPTAKPSGAPFLYTERFVSVVFLMKVLNKLRAMDDVQLNSKIERALVSIGKGMTVKEFVEILAFDPRAAQEAELRGDDKLAAQLWATSYTLNVIRRIASHDSLSFFVEHFFPSIQFCNRALQEAERAQRPADRTRWTALLVQYWRIAAGFCHYPLELTRDVFRDLFKQLVSLLSSPTFVDTSSTAIHVLSAGYYELAHTPEDEPDPGDLRPDDDEEDERLEDDLRAEERGRYKKSGIRRRQTTSRAPPLRTTKTALEEDDLFLALNDPSWAPHRYHNLSRARAAEVCETVLAHFSHIILPKLCNTFATHNSTAVWRAIASFARVSRPEVLAEILRGVLQVGGQIAAELRDAPSSPGEATQDPPQATTAQQRRLVIDIACAMVEQLSLTDLIQLLGDVIEPVLMDPAPPSRLLQKKAYKLLFSLFEHRVRDVFPMLPRVLGILAVGRQHLTISGIKMRLRCLSWALDAAKMFYPDELLPTIRTIVGEVILFSREHAHETRELAMGMLERMQNYLDSSGAPVSTLLHFVLAGLSSESPTMVCGAIVCLAKLVYLTHDRLPGRDLDGAIEVGLRLMDSARPEVRTAAAMFARMVLKLLKRSPLVRVAVEKSLPKLLYAIALVTSQPRVSSAVRVEMRVLLEKTLERFGYDVIEPMFPLGSKNFLRYTAKMLRREEKKTEREHRRRESAEPNEFDRFFMGAAMDTGAGDEVAGEDLLGPGALQSFVARHTAPIFPGLGGPSSDAREDTDEYDDMHLDFHDGKLRILTREERAREVEQQRRQALADRLLRRQPGGFLRADRLHDDAQRRPGKRDRFADDVADFTNDELVLRYGDHASATEAARRGAAAGLGLRAVVGPSPGQVAKLREEKAAKQAMKRARVEADIRKGDEFVGRGAGDVKRGPLEPFAYVPLNRAYLNRRSTQHALHRFAVIENKSLKGEKARAVSKSLTRNSALAHRRREN